ncbi:hypothetical protein LSAT2_004455 [Lamellibrachia satsuma]|nr:hypothetical protein LSAT2_004455 [Lamellibrachia satsuma]
MEPAGRYNNPSKTFNGGERRSDPHTTEIQQTDIFRKLNMSVWTTLLYLLIASGSIYGNRQHRPRYNHCTICHNANIARATITALSATTPTLPALQSLHYLPQRQHRPPYNHCTICHNADIARATITALSATTPLR